MSSKLGNRQTSETSKKEEFRNFLCFKSCTRLEKILCFVTITLLLMVIVMIATFVKQIYKKGEGQNTSLNLNQENLNFSNKSISNICLTPGCVKASAHILTNLDESIDPCNNFYQFACGKWMQENIIPEDKSYYSIYVKMVDNSNLKLRGLLEKELDGSEPSYIKMLKDMYDACMDIKSIEEVGGKPLIEILESLGGWPVIEGKNWDEDKFDWIETVISLRRLGRDHNIFLRLSVLPDHRNNSIHTIELDQASLGMSDRTYFIRGLNDSVTVAYYEKMLKAAKLLGADEIFAESELLETLKFEMVLANHTISREERRNASSLYNKYTVKKLQRTIPQIPWLKYFNGLLTEEIYKNETLIVAVPEYIKKLADLLSRTEKRKIANYMLWRVISSTLPSLSKKWREIDLEYNAVLTGKSRAKPRWEVCLSHVRFNALLALSSYYVHQYFTEETKYAALELVTYVHNEFLRILDEIDWMDEITKAHAKAKANNIKFYVGYPEELLNNTAVMEYYEQLSITNSSYFENIRSLNYWLKFKAYSKLRQPNIQRDWQKYSDSALVNAFYFGSENVVEIPAAILQEPAFSKDRPNYLNFGDIGCVIGHEITHGFDDKGRQYDKDGNNLNWWAETTDEHFKKKAQCIIDQYSNYTVLNGMKLNGVNTLGENIADNGAVKESYRAYNTWVKDKGVEQLLPGLKYNQNQLFWISAAQTWCGKHRPEELKRRIISFYHSPEEFRVNGPLSNSAEFAKDFNCPPDSFMNKRHKCHVW